MNKFIFFIIIAICFFPLIGEATSDELLRIKVELLRKQAELLSIQLNLLSAPTYAVFPERNNCAQLELSWERVSRATEYRLYRDGLLIYEGRNRSFVDSNLTLGRRYEYVVHGLYRGEEGEPSEVREIVAPTVCPPRAPDLFFKSDPCGGKITISWRKDMQATVYQLYRGNRKIYEGPLTSFVDSRLTPNRSYDYKIRAGNKGGWSDFSEVFSFSASGVCAPSAPKISYVTPETADEGDLLIGTKRTPAENNRIRAGYNNQTVIGFDLAARYSDINISRMDLYFNSQAWRYLDKIRVRYGSTTVFEEEINRDSFTSLGSGIYRLRIDNINYTIKENRTTSVVVQVTAKDSQPGYTTVFLDDNSIRAVDAAGFLHYLPKSGGGEGESFSRTFYIE